jgi:hypothetical protein
MPEPVKPSLSEKLKSLGVKIGATDIPPAVKKTDVDFPIETVMDGRFIPTRRGDTFLFEQMYPADYHHGLAPLTLSVPLDHVASWLRDPQLLDMQPEALAFLDTETSGLAGGTGTYAFLVGVGRFLSTDSITGSQMGTNGSAKRKAGKRRTAGRGVFQLAQFFMRDPSEEPALLEALADFLAPCRALVTFNGKAFDAPLLKTRYTLHSIPCPFADFAHLDMLPLARRLWRDRLPSRALKYLEENILLAPRTVDEVPGYEIPYIYFDYLRTADAVPLKGVFYHNAMDVVALAALTGHVAAILHDPFDGRVQHGLDFIALAKLFEELSQWDLAARLYERGLESQLPEADFWHAVQRLSALQRRRGDLVTAVHLWQQAAADGHVYAHVELAKYHEHRRKDYTEALRWTLSALGLVNELDIPRYIYNHWKKELVHRQERLESKVRGKPQMK